MKNPYAKALRVKPQQVISDKREKTYREVLNEELTRILAEDEELLRKLK